MRRALVLACLLAVTACGRSNKQSETPVLPPANPQALTKMAQGVEAAREPGGKKRAQGLFEEAIAAPEVVNASPYDQAWLIKVRLANPDQVADLLDAAAYDELAASMTH